MRFYRRHDGVWFTSRVDAGKDFDTVEIDNSKLGLLQFFNDNTVILGKPQDAFVKSDNEAERDPIEEAEQRAIAAAAPAPLPVQHQAVSRDWDATDIEDFILNRATVAQAGNIFACLGTRFKELAG